MAMMLARAFTRGGIEDRLAVTAEEVREAIVPHEGETRERACEQVAEEIHQVAESVDRRSTSLVSTAGFVAAFTAILATQSDLPKFFVIASALLAAASVWASLTSIAFVTLGRPARRWTVERVEEARRRYTRKLAYSQLSLILIASAFLALAASALVYEI
jgi:hypothetical protein